MTSKNLLPIMFKVYLKNNDGSTKEIRKFYRETNATGDFNYICEKLKQLFPELHDKDFTISWIDEDNDKIRISSNQDLQVATKCNTNLLKLYIHLCCQNEKSRENQTPNKGGPRHNDIFCDGCNDPVKGFRYKCIQCEDYDLCSQCETLGLHADHYMIRISRPQQWFSHSGQRFLRHIRKFLKNNGVHSNTQDIPDKFGKSCPMSKRCHEFSAPDHYIFPWLEAFGQSFNNVFEKMTKARSDDAGPSKEGKQEDKGNCERYCISGAKIRKDDLLWLLNLIGLDIDDETSFDTSNISENNKTKEKEERQTNVTTGQTGTGKIPEQDTKLVIDSTDKTLTSDNASVSSVETIIKKSDGAEEWTILDKIDTSDMSSASSISSGSTEKQVSVGTQLAPSASKEVNTTDQAIYPQLPKEEKSINHPNPNIHEALKTMIAMGFSNKSGLLTYLLETENGNINKVMDLLLS